jgi:hypothetical protein
MPGRVAKTCKTFLISLNPGQISAASLKFPLCISRAIRLSYYTFAVMPELLDNTTTKSEFMLCYSSKLYVFALDQNLLRFLHLLNRV